MRTIAGQKDLCKRIRDAAIGMVILLPILSGPLSAQDMLGRVKDDNLLSIPFDGSPSSGPVFAEINGMRQPVPARIVGSHYIIEVPDDLQGSRHDLRLIVEGSRDQEDLGWWLFETVSESNLVFGTVLSEIGVRTTEGEVDAFAQGVVRLEFRRNDGQQSGRLVLSRDKSSGVGGEDAVTVGDIFLETRFPAFGQDAFARIGNADIGADTILQDEASRRGLTFGLASPSGARTVTAFLLSPDTELGLDNVLGLSDKNTLVYGLSASLRPARLSGLSFDVATHRGRTRALPDEGTGDVSGSALSVALPFADGRGDLRFGLATSARQSDGANVPISAIARDVGVAWRLSDDTAYQQNELLFSYAQIEQGFFSPFNPSLISGEERIGATFVSISPAWQSTFSYELANTNFNGSTLAPTDRLSSLSLSLLHDPGDFTGGGLNGTTFYLNAGLDRQERLNTPTGAAPAADNRLARLSFGINKVQPTFYWGASLAFDDLDFDTSAANDVRKVFAQARLGISPSPSFSAQFFARAGGRETGGARFKEAEASIALIRTSANGLWETALEAGYLMSEDPAVVDGRSAVLSAARDIGNDNQIVGEVTWGSGRYAPTGTTNDGVSVGLYLRTDFGFPKK